MAQLALDIRHKLSERISLCLVNQDESLDSVTH
jgi:hypothetical protein